jgi:Mor family transcriptional regulator
MNAVTSNKNIEMLEYLEELIGTDNYKKVIDQFAGKVLYFPKRNEIAQKHEQIRREYAEGTGLRDLADKYRYTERHIREIVRGQEKQIPAHEGFLSRLGKVLVKRLKKIGYLGDNGV